MKSAPAEAVVGWTAAQPVSSLCTTSITQAEIFYGILLLPSGKRRRAIEAAAQAMFSEEFEGLVLAFGSELALLYARIAADRRRAGRSIAGFDAQIAAIARTNCRCGHCDHAMWPTLRIAVWKGFFPSFDCSHSSAFRRSWRATRLSQPCDQLRIPACRRTIRGLQDLGATECCCRPRIDPVVKIVPTSN